MTSFEVKLDGEVQEEIKAHHFEVEHEGRVTVFYDKHDEKLAALGMVPGVLIVKKDESDSSAE